MQYYSQDVNYQQQKFTSLQSQFFKKRQLKQQQLTQKSQSPSSKKKYRNQQYRQKNKFMIPQPIQDSIMQLKMKDNFDSLYQKIQQIAMKQQLGRQNLSKKLIKQQGKKINLLNGIQGVSTFDVKAKSYKSKSMISPRTQKTSITLTGISKNNKAKSKVNLQIKVSSNVQKKQKLQKQSYPQMILMRKSRYKQKLQPIQRLNLSNHIRDYLSVQKIDIKDLQQSLSPPKLFKTKQNYSFVQNGSNLLGNKNLREYKNAKQMLPTVSLVVNKKKFVPSFDTYYYRDLVWKASFANQFLVQIPSQYPFKVKIYLGKGNNSRLVKGIACRRSWYQVTQKIQQANFAWTQIKSVQFMSLQNSQKKKLEQQKLDIQYVGSGSILNQQENIKFKNYWKQNKSAQSKIKEDFSIRNKAFKMKMNKISSVQGLKIHNHFKNNFIIGNKKALFHTMTVYYKSTLQNIFDYLPLTFHLKNGIQDDEYLHFLKYFYQESKKSKKQELGKQKSHNVWVVKPGQLTNQGNGIIVCLSLEQIKNILKKKERHYDGTLKTFIVQKYIERPLLYKKRKFDLRHYMMITCFKGITKGYWCTLGYVRTTSSEYTLKFTSGAVHLTNDAVQKHLPDYGKYEKGNKLFYEELNLYLKKSNHKIDFFDDIYPKMKKVGTDTIRASAKSMDENKKNNLQIFGLDFMIDENYNVWLIQVNTNPCLQTTCPVLNKVIPKVLQDAMEIYLDPIYPAPKQFNPISKVFYQNCTQQNCFQLVYDERQNNFDTVIPTQLTIDKNLQQQEDDTFEDDGQDFVDD